MGLSRTRHTSKTFHSSSCRRHQYKFLRHGRSRTCPLVMRFYRRRSRHLGSTRLHHRHQQQLHMTLRIRRNSALNSMYQTQSHLRRNVGAQVHFNPGLLFQPRRLPARHACHASISQTSRQTGGSFRNNRETKEVPCSTKFQEIGDIQFHSQDVRQRKKSVLH